MKHLDCTICVRERKSQDLLRVLNRQLSMQAHETKLQYSSILFISLNQYIIITKLLPNLIIKTIHHTFLFWLTIHFLVA